MHSAVFLDRDGVINRKPPEGDYITRWEDMELLPGVVEGIALLNQANFCVIVITNQRCVAKGLISVAGLEEIHRRMTETLTRSGATLDAIYYCPHDLDASCGCRKPAPGMLLDAARSFGIDLRSSWMVGDSDIDVEAGRRAGCKTVLLRGTGDSNLGPQRAHSGQRQEANCVAPSLLAAARQILYREGFGSNSPGPSIP